MRDGTSGVLNLPCPSDQVHYKVDAPKPQYRRKRPFVFCMTVKKEPVPNFDETYFFGLDKHGKRDILISDHFAENIFRENIFRENIFQMVREIDRNNSHERIGGAACFLEGKKKSGN